MKFSELNLVSDIKRDIPKFGTVLTQAGATYGENTPTALKALSCGPKA